MTHDNFVRFLPLTLSPTPSPPATKLSFTVPTLATRTPQLSSTKQTLICFSIRLRCASASAVSYPSCVHGGSDAASFAEKLVKPSAAEPVISRGRDGESEGAEAERGRMPPMPLVERPRGRFLRLRRGGAGSCGSAEREAVWWWRRAAMSALRSWGGLGGGGACDPGAEMEGCLFGEGGSARDLGGDEGEGLEAFMSVVSSVLPSVWPCMRGDAFGSISCSGWDRMGSGFGSVTTSSDGSSATEGVSASSSCINGPGFRRGRAGADTAACRESDGVAGLWRVFERRFGAPSGCLHRPSVAKQRQALSTVEACSLHRTSELGLSRSTRRGIGI